MYINIFIALFACHPATGKIKIKTIVRAAHRDKNEIGEMREIVDLHGKSDGFSIHFKVYDNDRGSRMRSESLQPPSWIRYTSARP
jgi:hypothetical protein